MLSGACGGEIRPRGEGSEAHDWVPPRGRQSDPAQHLVHRKRSQCRTRWGIAGTNSCTFDRRPACPPGLRQNSVQLRYTMHRRGKSDTDGELRAAPRTSLRCGEAQIYRGCETQIVQSAKEPGDMTDAKTNESSRMDVGLTTSCRRREKKNQCSPRGWLDVVDTQLGEYRSLLEFRRRRLGLCHLLTFDPGRFLVCPALSRGSNGHRARMRCCPIGSCTSHEFRIKATNVNQSISFTTRPRR